MVREGDWKFYSNPREITRPEGIAELTQTDKQTGFLVNLAEDIGETTNVASQHPQVVQRLTDWAKEQQASIGK